MSLHDDTRNDSSSSQTQTPISNGNGKKRVVSGGQFLLEDIPFSNVFTREDFSDEHTMIAKTTEDFVKNEVMPALESLEKQEFETTVRLLKIAGQLGLLSADIPEQYGGVGLDPISSAIIAEKFAIAGGFSISHGAHVGIGTLPIVYFGNKKQKQTYLPRLASGEKIAAYALTEPNSGSDALGAKTSAKINKEGTHYILNGEKQWITNSAFADIFIVYAKVDSKHFTAFIVERNFPGVSTGPEEKKMGINSSSTRTLILQDVKVPKENVLGEIGKGHIIAFNILNIGRYKLAVGAMGSAKRALELSAKYATERHQFNTPIANFGLIQEKIATMAVKLYAVESAVWRTVGLFQTRMGALSNAMLEQPQVVANAIAEYAIECSIVKVFSTEALDFIADEGVQIHGGYGFMRDYEIERIYRDARINRIFEGTNEINRLLVSGTLIKKAIKGEVPVFQVNNDWEKNKESIGEDVLNREKDVVHHAKKIALLIINAAIQKYGTTMEREQEILGKLATMLTNIYAMESTVLRTEKAIDQHGLEKETLKKLYTEIYCEEAFAELIAYAKEIIVEIASGEELDKMQAVLRKLTNYAPINSISKKREIAKTIFEAKKYIV